MRTSSGRAAAAVTAQTSTNTRAASSQFNTSHAFNRYQYFNRSRRRLHPNSKRIKFRDRPDFIKGRYFIFTFPYALFYIIGAAVGYDISRNLFCLLISGAIGVTCLVMALAHVIDYWRGVPIEALYIALPFTISIFVAIFMTAIWALGTTFVSSGIVAIGAWIGVVFYFYGLLKDYGDGSQTRANDWHEQRYAPLSSQLQDEGDSNTGTETDDVNGPHSPGHRTSDHVEAADQEEIRRANIAKLQEEMSKKTFFYSR